MSDEADMMTEETEEKLVLTLAVSAKIKMGKAVRTVDFQTDFVLPDDLEEIALLRAHQFVEDEHKGWKLDKIEWEVTDEDEEEEEEEAEDEDVVEDDEDEK